MSSIETILNDLYQVDPSLKQREPELRKIIQELVAAKPDTKFDESFAKNLRRQLAAKTDTVSQPHHGSPRYLSLLFGGVVMVAIVLLGAQYYNIHKINNTITPQFAVSKLLTDNVQVDHVGKNAFGTLAFGQAPNTGFGGGSSADTASQKVVSGMAPLAEPTPATGTSFGMGGGVGSARIMPPAVQYSFVYKGEDLPALSVQMDVYKRIKGFADSIHTSEILKQLPIGLLDTSKFSDTELQNITFGEHKQFGYIVTINPTEGTLNIGQNYAQWPHPEQNCQDQSCFDQYKIAAVDVPADNAVIAIADQFLSDYKISKSNYGTPTVQATWRIEYEAAVDKSQAYVPDTVSVIYPFQVNGKNVLDESGNPTGLTVNVNIREKRVSDISELSNQKYEASAYDTETGSERILSIAAKGGYHSYSYNLPDAKKVEVDLGLPTIAYIRTYQNNNSSSFELLVPAYVFPVINPPAGQPYFAKNIIVPIIKQILDNESNNSGPVPLVQVRSGIMK